MEPRFHCFHFLPDVTQEQGWKIIHGDVFRFPQYKSLLCAIIGVGTQVVNAT